MLMRPSRLATQLDVLRGAGMHDEAQTGFDLLQLEDDLSGPLMRACSRGAAGL